MGGRGKHEGETNQISNNRLTATKLYGKQTTTKEEEKLKNENKNNKI